MATALVGREREVEEMDSALAAALRGDCGVVLVSGEPGIGKSRLLEELATRARAEGAAVLSGRCWEAGGAPPYWPWVQALRGYMRTRSQDELRDELGVGAGDLAQMLPEVRQLLPGVPEPPESDPEQARFRMFDSAASFLRTASMRTPLLIVIDDLHAADTPSLLFLRFLARDLADARLLVAAAYRDTALHAEHPLTETIAEALREPTTRKLALRGLTETDVARYLGSVEETTDVSSLAHTIYDETEGNPLFVTEVVRMLAAEGGLGADGGRRRIPQSLREVIGRRMAQLSEKCLRVLTAAAVYGRDFELTALEAMTGVSRDELLAVTDEATRAGVIEEIAGTPGGLRFSHVLFRETLYEDLAPSQRVEMHRRAGEVLERLHADDLTPHLSQIAHHYFQAAPEGDAMPAVRFAHMAGECALDFLAHEDAVLQFETALRALDLTTDDEDGTLRVELLLLLGEAEARSGDKAASRTAFRRAADQAKRLGNAELLGRAALGYGGRFVWEASRDDPSLPSLLAEALDALPEEDSELRVRLMARLAGGPWRDDPDRDPRERMSRAAVDMARRLGDVGTLGYALDGRYAAVWWPENLDERIGIATELIDVSRRAGDLERELQAHHYLGLALMERGDMDGARAEVRAQREIAERLRQPAQRLYVNTVEAMLALFEARFDQADEMITHAHDAGSSAERAMADIYRAMQGVVLRSEQGRGAEALDALRGAAAAFPSYVVLRCVLAWTLSRLGRGDQAAALVRQLSANGFAGIPRNDEWLFGMTMLAEAAARAGAVDVAEELREILLPYRERIAVSAPEVSAGAVARPLGSLAASLGRWEDAAADMRLGLEINERCGARGWAAWSQLHLGVVLLRRERPDDRDEGLGLLRSALTSAQELGMAALEEEAAAALRAAGEDIDVAAPRVVRTFMFTDIEGSTALLEAIGDDSWQRLRAWHDRTLREQFAAHGAEEVEHTGDGFFVAFSDPAGAVRCAVEIQRRLEAHRASQGFAPQVRIGIHSAEASITGDGYAGKGVHQAARLSATAAGGEIVVSGEVAGAAEGVAAFGGERIVELKGIAGTVAVRSVEWRASTGG